MDQVIMRAWGALRLLNSLETLMPAFRTSVSSLTHRLPSRNYLHSPARRLHVTLWGRANLTSLSLFSYITIDIVQFACYLGQVDFVVAVKVPPPVMVNVAVPYAHFGPALGEYSVNVYALEPAFGNV